MKDKLSMHKWIDDNAEEINRTIKKNAHDNFTPFSIYCDVEQFKYSALYV